MAAVKLLSACKDYIWGGTKLKEKYHKENNSNIIAETWELSTHKDGESRIAGGNYDGCSLSEYIEKEGKKVLGSHCEKFPYFPVLIKLIDAKENLSIQVHPDNEYAMRVEKEYGKTEMWYILEHEEDVYLYYGWQKDISREELEERIKNNTILQVLNKVKVKKGDVFFIEAGTIHAIGAGIVICEIQQNSNTTYRVYDYGRVDKEGKARELHIEKAKDVTKLSKMQNESDNRKMEIRAGYEKEQLADCEYFKTLHVTITQNYELYADESSFISLIVTEGSGFLNTKENTLPLEKGDSIFIPAGEGVCVIQGELEVIQTEI